MKTKAVGSTIVAIQKPPKESGNMDMFYFETNGTSRTTDPTTSHKAGAKVTNSGARQSIANKIYEQLSDIEGLTFEEVAHLTGLKESQVWKRLSDLKNKGKIYQNGERDGRGLWWIK